MLGFVTSIRHPSNSIDYGEVESLLKETVACWERQLDHAWLGVVVGNKPPSFNLPEKVRYIHVDFPPPSQVQGPRTGITAVLRDKGTKLAIGTIALQGTDVSHIMFVDADDLVSPRLAGVVKADPDSPGWTITHGWRYNADRRAIREHPGDFHLQCGSSHIVRADLLPHADLATTADQDSLYTAYGDYLERWFGSHMFIHDDLPLRTLPFPGAMYRVGSAESHSGNSMGGLGRPITRRIADEFGVKPTSLSPWHVARSVLPSWRAARERVAAKLSSSASR